MRDFSYSNKLIAANTFYLYVRMILILLITLYTSRVVLQQLGVVDFGIYNVVGSLVLMFTFIKGALTSSTSRYLAYEIGLSDDGDVQKVFCMSVNIHLLFALFVFVCCETFGIWYFYNEMNIPEDREQAAFVVFHLSNLAAIVSILSVPYQGIIVAYERMKSFAYLSLLDVVLKLGIALVLFLSPCEKIIFYAVLLLAQNVIIQLFYVVYCFKKFQVTRYKIVWDKSLFKEMLTFSGWSIGSYLSTAFVGQCVNLILNIFFGPVVNAARAIAFQVQGAVNNFVSNFQVALNPQIIKTCASKDYERMHDLILLSMKISFSLVFFIAYPLMCCLSFVLGVWLVEVPANTEIFISIIMFSAVIIGITNSLSVAAEASNRLKLFNGVTTPYYLSSLLVCYMFFKLGFPPYSAFVIILLYDFFGFFIKLFIIREVIRLDVKPCLGLFAKIILIILGAYLITILYIGEIDDSWYGLIVKFLLCCVYSIPMISFVIFSKDERNAFAKILFWK